MNTMEAFAMGEAHRGCELMVFDWNEAARRIKASGCSDAYAGLRGDWEYTGGTIFLDGKPYFKGYTYLASTWAVPELEIDGKIEPCYKMQSETPGWGSDTKWPQTALMILNMEG